jgi:hypothetical protein
MDKLLSECGSTDLAERAMDSNDHEKEVKLDSSSRIQLLKLIKCDAIIERYYHY